MRDLKRLTRPMLRLLGRDDRGVVGILVGVLVGGGVLLGMGALVVDVGQIYAERAQLQSGADAGALAVAKSCVQGYCSPVTAVATAQSYADANANDGASAINLLCGADGLGDCPQSTGQLTDCPGVTAPDANYVDVHTATRTASGSSLLPPVFAKTLLGNQDYNGTTVFACAQAEWGAPKAASGMALTVSACEWDKATNDGILFAQPPPYPPNVIPDASFDQVLKLHTSSAVTSTCPTEPAGSDGPGMFGWTSDPADNCLTGVIGGSYGVKTGIGVPTACKSVLSSAQANRTLVYLPIYTVASGNGQGSGSYTLKGFAAFVITGYSFPGFFASDWLNPANDCSGSDKCINGYFTHGLIPIDQLPNGGTLGGTDLGADIIKLTG